MGQRQPQYNQSSVCLYIWYMEQQLITLVPACILHTQALTYIFSCGDALDSQPKIINKWFWRSYIERMGYFSELKHKQFTDPPYIMRWLLLWSFENIPLSHTAHKVPQHHFLSPSSPIPSPIKSNISLQSETILFFSSFHSLCFSLSPLFHI